MTYFQVFDGTSYITVTSPPGPSRYPVEGDDLPRSVGDITTLGSGTYTDWDDDWTYPPLLNGWVDFDANHNNARYRRLPGGLISIEGLVKGGSSIGAAVFVLPVGYRPINLLIFPTFGNSANPYRLNVSSAGSVYFTTGSTTWMSIECRFFAEDWAYG